MKIKYCSIPVILLLFSNVYSQTTPKEIFQKGIENYFNSKFQDGIKYFDEYIKSATTDPLGYTYRGLCYQSMKNYPKAIDDFTTVINLGKNNPDGYIYRGNTYVLQRNLPSALTDFSDAIRYGPDNIEGYLGRARAYVLMEDYPSALKDVNLAVGVAPRDARVYVNKAFVRYLSGDTAKVLDDVNLAFYNDSDMVFTDIKREYLFMKIEIFKASNKLISNKINHYPDDFMNYFMRGFFYYMLNSYDKSKKDLATSLKLSGNYGKLNDTINKIKRSIKRNS
ncbi:MAG: hypothetical protein HGGPFJEG_00878 [Ignavibacteria bacterium]|nr:hypothetical protein [Ignavibacteria bacterium]